MQECDRLEALLETAREGNAQQASEQLESLHTDLASLRQQLVSSEEQVQVLEQDLQVYTKTETLQVYSLKHVLFALYIPTPTLAWQHSYPVPT